MNTIKRMISTEFFGSKYIPTKWQRFIRRYFGNGKYVFHPQYKVWCLKTLVWGVVKDDGWFYPFTGQHVTWRMFWPYGIDNIEYETSEFMGEKIQLLPSPKYKQFADLF